MPSGRGIIALMGSGELTATMVEVHKELIMRLGGAPRAFFLDTPAGFQLNADQLSERAVEYFRVNVGYPLNVVSFKSKGIPALDAKRACHMLNNADYLLVGPGSPTYAIRQWQGTSIPDILIERIVKGACLTVASAAALTIGRLTLPVYEIYKVGQELQWVDGLNVLNHFGLDVIVIPHWNNEEGGNHDTRFCFMGEARFRVLESMLPEGVSVLGLDEHTACVIDLSKEEFSIKGIGRVTLRYRGFERTFSRAEHLPLRLLADREPGAAILATGRMEASASETVPAPKEADFWEAVHAFEAGFRRDIDTDAQGATNALLELDRLIWRAKQEKENPESIFQARELFHELVVFLGMRLASSPGTRRECLAPLVEELLALRALFKHNNQWREADAIRNCLKGAQIEVDDTRHGYRWRLVS